MKKKIKKLEKTIFVRFQNKISDYIDYTDMVLHNFAFHVNGYFVLRTEKKLTFSNFLFRTHSFSFHIINLVDWQITWNGISSTVGVGILSSWTFIYFPLNYFSVWISESCFWHVVFFKCLKMTEFQWAPRYTLWQLSQKTFYNFENSTFEASCYFVRTLRIFRKNSNFRKKKTAIKFVLKDFYIFDWYKRSKVDDLSDKP